MKLKPPILVNIKNFESFSRLALALTDTPPLLWYFKHNGKKFLGTFSVYVSWKGDLPLFAYMRIKSSPGSFLAYKSDLEKEEFLFTNNIEDTRYVYAPIINLKKPPKIFQDAFDKKPPGFKKPIGIELDGIKSMMRLLYLVSIKEYTSFPVWRFRKGRKYILGVCIPFERYYEANALPVFFYVKERKPPLEPFIRYSTSRVSGENVEYTRNTADTKFFYAKIIDVKDMPLFPE